jgi:hypothetical protein
VELVLKRLRDEKLFAKLSKCGFNKPSVTFLGHVVGQEGLRMGRKKVECVLQWPRPATKLEVLRFEAARPVVGSGANRCASVGAGSGSERSKD